MMYKVHFIAAAVFAIVGLSACSTPSAVSKQAEHGVSLTSQLDLELKAFRKAEANSEKFLLDSSAYQKRQIVALNRAIRENDLAMQATGDVAVRRVVDTMTGYLQSLATLDATTQTEIAGATKATADVLAPLPSTTEALTDTQSKFAEFGKEIPLKVRAQDFKLLVDAVDKVITDNKKKMKEAAESATAASSPTN